MAQHTLSRGKSSQKNGLRRDNINKIYTFPLPLVFFDPAPNQPRSVFSFLGLPLTNIENPHCDGYLDMITHSVWVVDSVHSKALWRRGFFGKGDLSRSEPSWLARQINIRQLGGKSLSSEEITSKRREERKQFKLDRARAIAAVAAQAEQVFATEGRVIIPTLSGPEIPSSATWRPTRPSRAETSNDTIPLDPIAVEDDSGEVHNEVELNDIEHLQLTFQEAFFLVWNLGCLSIRDPDTGCALSIEKLWALLRSCYPPLISLSHPLQLDNSFLFHYAVYHHYRSLGWVVKGGIKFCVDYLLYKRGPVFSHAEFAIVVLPVYQDPEDETSATHNKSPLNWQWLSTINRVNAQVQKTLVLTYVIIPAKLRVDPEILTTPAVLGYYTIREVIFRRFIPARVRD